MVASDTGKNPATSRDMRETRYRIKDNYSVFYLKYVEPAPLTKIPSLSDRSTVSTDGIR